MRPIEDAELPVELVEDDLVSALATREAIVAGIGRLLEHLRNREPVLATNGDARRKKVSSSLSEKARPC